jgi:hypothetical protein
MTNPRRPDDARLSTADLAAAGDRAAERPNDPAAAQQRPAQRVPQETGGRPVADRPVADRDVTEAQLAQRAEQERREQRDQRLQHADAVANAAASRRAADIEHSTPLFAGNEAEEFRRQWGDIQTGFVDEPRQAVERADALVASAIKRLAEIFARERATLEQQWARGGDVSTEDLRVALRRYRGFFDRLLSV